MRNLLFVLLLLGCANSAHYVAHDRVLAEICVAGNLFLVEAEILDITEKYVKIVFSDGNLPGYQVAWVRRDNFKVQGHLREQNNEEGR